jgi:hypothetical protein
MSPARGLAALAAGVNWLMSSVLTITKNGRWDGGGVGLTKNLMNNQGILKGVVSLYR